MKIYRITNLINGKCYIGQTTRTLKQRWYHHVCRNESLVSLAIKKYGKENFKLEELKSCDDIESLNFYEKFFIKEFNTLAPNGYNLTTGGKNRKLSEQTKIKIGNWHSGKKLSIEHKNALIFSRKGKKNSTLHNLKISKALQGKPKTEEHKKTLSKIRQGINWRKHNKPVLGNNSRTGTIIKFDSATEASRNGFNQAHVRECCLGIRKSHHGFQWKYV